MRQSLKSILENLSPKLKEAFYSDHTSNIIKDAAVLGQIKIDDTQKLNIIEGDVMDVILGRTPVNHFLENLKVHLDIPETNIMIINKVIQERLFESLKNDLNQLAVNKPKLTFTPQPTTTIKEQNLKSIPKQEEAKPKKIEELLQKTKPIEEKPKEEIKKPSVPDLSLPEVPEIKIERPVNKTGELKRVAAPEVTPEEQEKIHSRLLEAIQKKEIKPKILEQIKKVLESGAKTQPETKTPEKPITPAETLSASKVVGGDNNEKFKTEPKPTSSNQKPYIFDVKLKKEEVKKETLPKGEIKYQKTTEKPFGEA